MNANAPEKFQSGDVFQINETHGRKGWIGCFVLATEIKSWGIQGFVCMIEDHEKQGHAYIRLKWSELDYVGPAALIPGGERSEHRPEPRTT